MSSGNGNKSVGKIVAGMSDQNIRCRTPNHPWTIRTVTYHTLAGSRRQLLRVVSDCDCGAVATDIWDAKTFEIVVPRRINYSGTDNYLVTGYGRVGKAPFRREFVGRVGVQEALVE